MKCCNVKRQFKWNNRISKKKHFEVQQISFAAYMHTCAHILNHIPARLKLWTKFNSMCELKITYEFHLVLLAKTWVDYMLSMWLALALWHFIKNGEKEYTRRILYSGVISIYCCVVTLRDGWTNRTIMVEESERERDKVYLIWVFGDWMWPSKCILYFTPSLSLLFPVQFNPSSPSHCLLHCFFVSIN